MDSPFLTLSEASAKTGRSLSTIRRLIKSISDKDSHSDRAAVQPSPKEVALYRKKDENFAWKIREDVLMREFSSAPEQAKKSVSYAKGDILSILQKELDLKNQQIEKQWEVIHALNDRLREGNILMGTLQKQLALPSPEEQEKEVVEATAVPSSMEASKKSSRRTPKKKVGGSWGWLHW